MLEEVFIDKLVHGGQGIGTLADGRRVFVWNALPGEKVRIKLWRRKKKYAEGCAEEIIDPSPDRISPKESNFLGTSPWQIMTFASENKYKQQIIDELFSREGVELPKFVLRSTKSEFNYRNKMEYSFWADNDGLHLALFNRGSHQKQLLKGSALAMPAIDKTASIILKELNKLKIRGSDLKSVVVRCNQAGESVASLFVKRKDFPEISLPANVKGLRVYYSNPKSPASVATELLYEQGTVILRDTLLGKEFVYDVNSFFQVNIPVFEIALEQVKNHVTEPQIVDMYAGVGSIGLSLAAKSVDLVELDAATAAMARHNAEGSGLDTRVIETSTENALDYISGGKVVIFDPPRAGLHQKVIDKVLDALPPKVVYLSCNPATQARDLKLLSEKYKIAFFEAYNFFPRTPHIETLAVLELQ